MTDFQNIWAIFTGVFGILMAVPLIACYIHSQLPTRKLRSMFDLLGDANTLLLSCTEEGLVYGRKVQNYETKLAKLRSHAEEARLKATAAKSYYEELANWWKGLTRRIDEICKNVRDVRADISSNSLRERERLEAQRHNAMVNPGDGDDQLEAIDNLSVAIGSASTALPEDATVMRDLPSSNHASAPIPTTNAPPLPHTVRTSTTTAAHDITASPAALRSFFEILEASPTPLSIATIPTVASLSKTRSGDRRSSVSSGSSNNSSAKSVRLKRGGDPLSRRARAMARFVHHTRTSARSPLFFVDTQELTAFKLIQNDDGDDEHAWVDERVIRVVA